MPTISVNKRLLDKHLGDCLSKDQIEELCFQYGLEVDDVISETNEATGNEEQIYKIEIPANRYDLLCVEGLTRALLIFQNKLKPPIYEVADIKHPVRIIVSKETENVRKFVVGAVLRDFHFDADVYASFIDLQDKLHQNIGRKRTLASIGTHDMDTVKGPFRYCARRPEEIVFKPLNQSREYTAAELMDLYSTSHLREYLPIIRCKPLYPVIYDANGVLCSMPPIINSEHSKISLNTRNIFIEATGTDLKKLEILLDTVVAMFGQYCAKPFVIEPVEIEHPNGTVDKYPKLAYRDHLADVQHLSATIGVPNVGTQRAMDLLARMSLHCEPILEEKAKMVDIEEALRLLELANRGVQMQREQKRELIKITIPPIRHDILHECDLAEDLALAFGFNAIPPSMPQSNTIAEPLALNKLSDQLRLQMATSGWTEVLNFALCSTEDVGTKLRRPVQELENVVRIANPKTLEFQVVRNSLFPGILKTIGNNKDMPMPLRLFEVQDVVHIDQSQDTKCRNERRLAAVFYAKNGSFEVLHGLLDRIMQMLDVPSELEEAKNGDKSKEKKKKMYRIRQAEDPSYFGGRCAEILFDGARIGTFGVLHPEVLSHFALTHPCSALELSIEPFLD